MPTLGPAPTAPPMLHKYLGCAEHHFKVLEDLRIRFTQPDELNDPEDCVPAMLPPEDLAAYVDEIFERNRAGAIAVGNSADDLAGGRDIMLAELQSDPDRTVVAAHDIVRGHLNQIGVLSLTTDPFNLVMWAHYSGNHAGFVVGFRPIESPFVQRHNDYKVDTGQPRPIAYRPDRVTVRVQPLTIPPDILYVKRDTWSYEREWRVTRRLDACDHHLPAGDSNPWLHLCDVDPSTVAQIIVGHRADQSTLDRLIAATAAGGQLSHVNVLQARLNAGRTQLEAVPLT